MSNFAQKGAIVVKKMEYYDSIMVVDIESALIKNKVTGPNLILSLHLW